MKLLILRNNLKEGVDTASRIAQKSTNLPILESILLETEKSFLKLSATNLEIGIRFWILSQIEKEGKIALPGKIFANLINSLIDEKITLETSKQSLLIKGANFQARILGQPAEDFPIIPDVTGETIELQAAPFLKGLSDVVDVAAPTQVRPELSGIFISFRKTEIVMAASDSFRLAEKKLEFTPDFVSPWQEKDIILPQRAARELINILEGESRKIKVCLVPNQILFEAQNTELSLPKTQLVSRLIEGEYPRYQEVIPSAFQTKIRLEREEFLRQIKVASLFGSRINEVRIEIEPKKERVGIFAQNPDIGENSSSLKAFIEGEKVTVSFNHRFLLDGLFKISDKEVELNLSGAEGPALLRAPGDDSYFYIVMPIKPT